MKHKTTSFGKNSMKKRTNKNDDSIIMYKNEYIINAIYNINFVQNTINNTCNRKKRD